MDTRHTAAFLNDSGDAYRFFFLFFLDLLDVDVALVALVPLLFAGEGVSPRPCADAGDGDPGVLVDTGVPEGSSSSSRLSASSTGGATGSGRLSSSPVGPQRSSLSSSDAAV
eukprot:TRINITY_DN15160_c0_g1_i2.p5 TRINITY_DN15160_c0_g1~~TRINITY_DN15160_c0_g1_i2.p5  ORF type:complete len:112 (-),score=7.90 TRINITY_DN15160_c0_g1_i2:1990-2325(-)